MQARLTTVTAALVLGFQSFALAQAPATQADPSRPAPGTRGNADNVPYIGKSDPQGNPVRLSKATGHISNYSEDKVAPYTLPDPLVMADGRKVASSEMWFKERRPEILKFYENEIYGRVPDNAPKVTWEVTDTDPSARNGTAIMQHVVGRLGDKPDAPKVSMTVYRPANAKGPVPMLLSISFGFTPGGRGAAQAKAASTEKSATEKSDAKSDTTKASEKSDAQKSDAAKAAEKSDTAKAPPAGRGPVFDSIGEVLNHGWGYATLTYTDIQPDRLNSSNQGVIGLTLKEGQSKPADNEWGSISAWAWGISRAIDYFETDPNVNAKQIAITGASRLGKTVLWAAAEDPRVAAVFSVVSGEMGAALIRRDWGETLDDMAQNFPWQFCGNLQKWAGRWNELPVDQHMLIALSAPRPVYVNGGIGDQWSDPKGEFLSMVAAGPVYRLLGAKDLGVTDVPELDHPIATGDLAFHYHSSGHTAVPADWMTFLEFAQRHFDEQRAN
jgi:hypothetical protein